jgi:hypothetical protein
MEERLYDIEAIIENGTYSDTVTLDVLNLMMKANIVSIRGTSVRVSEIEVTEMGVVRFHGNRAEL